MSVAVVGAGISGLVAALTLAKAGLKVVIYEKENYLGGHARTVHFNGIACDLSFMIFNRVTFPHLVSFLEENGVDVEATDISFSVSLEDGKGCEWCSKGLWGLFAQKRNLFNPCFLQMVGEILKFKRHIHDYLQNLDEDVDENETLGGFLQKHRYSNKFKECYLIPMCASISSCSSDQIMNSSASCILSLFRNHHVFQMFEQPNWLAVRGRAQAFAEKIIARLKGLGAELRLNCAVGNVVSSTEGICVIDVNGTETMYDKCVIGVHAPDALQILGDGATYDERSILGAFQYSHSDVYLHRDKQLMPRNPALWCTWNFLGHTNGRFTLTYWLSLAQNIGGTEEPFLVTLNPTKSPSSFIHKWRTSHPIPSFSAAKAHRKLIAIQGKRGIWFCGAYQGYGFHEDGFKAGLLAANNLLNERTDSLPYVKRMVFSWQEAWARNLVLRFLHRLIANGQIQLLETGGTVVDIAGKSTTCNLKCHLRIHRPSFYWKIATRANIGLAEAYIDGDFTFIDAEHGLLNFMLVLIKNIVLKNISNEHRDLWNPISLFNHVFQKGQITYNRKKPPKAPESIDYAAIVFGETLIMSCALFKGPEEPLKDAQLRKLHTLIDKARIDSNHEVLELGFGYGSLAIEVVRRTGCRYTGTELSKEILEHAQERINKSGLQDKITLKLCDYMALPDHKYDRIISCEMIEAVGHKRYKEYFNKCDHLLATNGLMVVQVISVPDGRYEEHRRNLGLMTEYLFPYGCMPCSLPSISILTKAMGEGSSLCIQHLEDLGLHYYQSHKIFRNRLLSNQSELKILGIDEKTIRKREYYMAFSAAAHKAGILRHFQIVFSRLRDTDAMGNIYQTTA